VPYLEWSCTPVGNACWLEPVENVERSVDLKRGVPFGKTFPRDARFRMNKSFKKNTALVDDVKNGSSVKVCSKRLVEFLQKEELRNVEYLPVTILDHKGKVASEEYFIVHPLGLQDALDVKASKPSYNEINPKRIDFVEKIVVDESCIEPGIKVFRLAGLTLPIFIEKKLGEAIQSAGFVGPSFHPIEAVRK
jgi:hypothetical protein